MATKAQKFEELHLDTLARRINNVASNYLDLPRAQLEAEYRRAKRASANQFSATKPIRKVARRTEIDASRRSRVRTFLRKFEDAIAAGDVAVAKAAFVEAQSELMRAVSKGIVHPNTGSRKVSRLAARIKMLDKKSSKAG